MGVEINYMMFHGGSNQVTSISCNAHDSQIENLKDSEYGFSRFFVYTSMSDYTNIFYTCCIERDVEGEELAQDLPFHWIVL